jgi:hypothetical protein
MEHSPYYNSNKINLDKQNFIIEEIDREMCSQFFQKNLSNCKSHEINYYATVRYNRRVFLINQCQELVHTHRCPVVCNWVKTLIEIFRQINQMDLSMASHPLLINALQNNKLTIIHVSRA